jgi:hypothetical protein
METPVMLTLIGGRWQRRGAIEGGGAPVLLRPRRRVVQHQGAVSVLLDLMVELERLYFSLASAAARQRRWLGSFLWTKRSQGKVFI